MADKPKALRLADVLNHKLGGAADEDIEQAAAELRRLSAVEAERDEDRRREYGYSQQTVDAITNERDALRAERDALLAALENAVDCWQTEGLLTDGHVQAMLAAIAKAKGGGNG